MPILEWTDEERLLATAPWGSELQRSRWQAPDTPTLADWADENRILAGEGVLEPGPWRTDRTPYLREVMNALSTESDYREVVLMASARVGKTEVGNNATAYWAATDPEPTLLVWPDRDRAEEEVHGRIAPMLKASPSTAALFSKRSWDVQKRFIRLANEHLIRVGWSRSATSLAGFQACHVVFDEIDKYGAPSSESDPVTLGEDRAMQYGDRKRILKASTPTTRWGPICKAHDNCRDRRKFHVPCPHCGHMQTLEFGRFRWEGWETWKETHPDTLRHVAEELMAEEGRVWYECSGCSEPIYDRHKRAMLSAGEWYSDGFPPGEHPASTKVAFHIWAAYSPWVSWREIVHACLTRFAKGSHAYQGFVNSWLGEPFEQEQSKIPRTVFLSRRVESTKVPDWTRALVCGVDTQQDCLYYTIRAFGSGRHSRGITFGKAEDFDHLRRLVLDRSFEIEGRRQKVKVRALGIDVGGGKNLVGTRTDDVYRFVSSDPSRIWALKGRGGEFNPDVVEPYALASSGKNKLHGVQCRLLNTQFYKTQLAGRILADDPVLWEECMDVDEDYCTQMSNEHQILRELSNGRSYLWWQTVSKDAPNHYWDASVYTLALADMLHVDELPTLPKAAAHARAQIARRRNRQGGFGR